MTDWNPTNAAYEAKDQYHNVPGLPVRDGKGFTMKRIEWLWPGWLARGKFHLNCRQQGSREIDDRLRPLGPTDGGPPLARRHSGDAAWRCDHLERRR